MVLLLLLLTAILTAAPAAAQQTPASLVADGTTGQAMKDQVTQDHQGPGSASPVSLTKIREALETTPIVSLRTLDETPTFRVQIL